MSTFLDIATEIGELVAQKNEAYGSSFAKAGEFLRLLYPDGLTPAQYDDALLLVRVFDKQMRIATDRDALGESPYADIAGYGILGVHLHHQRKEQEAWPGSANVPNATPSPAAPTPVSAAPNTSAKTTTSASASSDNATSPKPSTPPASSSAEPVFAPAQCATEVVSERLEGLVQDLAAWKSRNDRGLCAFCTRGLGCSRWTTASRGSLQTCSKDCATLLGKVKP